MGAAVIDEASRRTRSVDPQRTLTILTNGNNKAQREPTQRTMIVCPSPMQNHHRLFRANPCVQARRLHSDETFRPFWPPFALSDDCVCKNLRFFMIWEIWENGNLRKSRAVWQFFGFPEMPFCGSLRPFGSFSGFRESPGMVILRKSRAVRPFFGFPPLGNLKF